MNTIAVTIKDKLAIISFNRPKSNSLNKEMVSELHQMLNDIENDPNIGAAIITGKDNFFSAGLDLIELYDYNLEEAKDFWHLFLKFVAKITAFKKPLMGIARQAAV
jgi:Delta3-Delta2-enoyl-CoA isomerase